MRQLSHPCVIQLIDIIYPTDPKNFNELYIVMEKADSDLKKIYKNNMSLDLVHIKAILYNLLLALKYMH